MKTKTFLFILFWTWAIAFYCSADAQTTAKPELKIPLDSYYVKAPDGDRLDNYLKKRESKVLNRLIKPDASPYTVRVATLSSNTADAPGVIVKVSARKAGESAYRSFMVRNLLGSTLLYEQTTSGGTAVTIALVITQLSGSIYYADVTITNCSGGDVYIETEKF
jgi:hypothetical protein